MTGRFSRIRAVVALAMVAGGLTVVGSQGVMGLADQSGGNNYAGPRSCETDDPENAHETYGVTFDVCGPNTNVLSQESDAGLNVYEATGFGTPGTVTQTNGSGNNLHVCHLDPIDDTLDDDPLNASTDQSCESNQATTSGDNTFSCVLNETDSTRDPVTNQSCRYHQTTNNQTGTPGGNNFVVADIRASQTFRTSAAVLPIKQVARMSLEGAQLTDGATGNNTVSGPTRAAADADAPPIVDPALMEIRQTADSQIQDNLPPNQTQERCTVLDVDQFARGGHNSVDFNLDSDQWAQANGLHPTQEQDVGNDSDCPRDPNAQALVFQRSKTGTNYTKGRGVDKKYEESTTRDSDLGFSATQHQWNPNGGFHIQADLDTDTPDGGTIDFGTPASEGTACEDVDGFRKLGEIVTKDADGNPTTAGERSQDDPLPFGILGGGRTPKTATVAGCSKLIAPAGTSQVANLSVDGTATQAVTGAIAATLLSGVGSTTAYVPFNAQTVHVDINCTRNTTTASATPCDRTRGGVTGSGVDVRANEDVTFRDRVATFTNDDLSRPVASADIAWGDGVTSTSKATEGDIEGSGNGPYVYGTHSYEDPGEYTIHVTLKYGDGTVAADMNSTAYIADVPAVTGSGVDVSANEDETFRKPVATFTNDDPSRPVTSADIAWGDGGTSTSTDIEGSGNGPYTVYGTHSYEDPGEYTIDVTLKYGDGSVAANMSSTARIADVIEPEYLALGSFVIGDGVNLDPGSEVTFWSDQWNPPNPMSSLKSAPSSFKGFQNKLTGPDQLKCGQPVPTWESRTGNAPPPPGGTLPRYMAVAATSNVTSVKKVPTGDVQMVVIIDTLGTTYGPSPSQTGKGKVVRVLCRSSEVT